MKSNMNSKVRTTVFFLILFAILFIFFVFALCNGHYSLDPITCIKMLILKPFGVQGNWQLLDESVLFGIRLPRIIGAIVVGACLSLSGATYQSIFQNPLVSPDILGVSSGACVGAAVAILLHLSRPFVMLLAFGCGILTVFATLAIPKLLKSDSNIMLVLSGIVVSGLTSSILGIIKYVADPQSELPKITYWTMGALDGVTFATLMVEILPIIICTIILICMAWWINIIAQGETDAKILGANVPKIRLIAIICSTLLTALAVCMSGTIGWIGLVIPHFARMFVGPDNTKLMPAATILGSVFLLLVDTVARNIAAVEIPLSIITGFIGAPFYAWLLYKQRLMLH